MSNPQSPAYREGIWEIRETTITALLPEGAWVLQVGDIEFIRLQSGTENGVAFCDAFIKPRDSSRPYPVGRYASEKEGICKVLGQFANWNGVPLLGASGQQKMRPAESVAISSPRRQVIPFPKSPDYPLQTEKPPISKPDMEEGAPREDMDPDPGVGLKGRSAPKQESNPVQNLDSQLGFEPNQGFDPQQAYDPGQGFDPQREYDPRQGYGPRQTWWQWAFNPANPQFRKTMIILSSIIVLLILLGASGVFRGLRLQSVSGPGIVGIYFLLRAMKNRKPKDRFGTNTPPNASSWDPYAQQPGAWNAGSGNSDDTLSDSAAAPNEAANPNDSAAAPNDSAEKKDAHNPDVDRQDT